MALLTHSLENFIFPGTSLLGSSRPPIQVRMRVFDKQGILRNALTLNVRTRALTGVHQKGCYVRLCLDLE